MAYFVNAIEFDFEDEVDTLNPAEQLDIINDTVGHIWEADNEDDLIEVITSSTGWLIKSIEYHFTGFDHA